MISEGSASQAFERVEGSEEEQTSCAVVPLVSQKGTHMPKELLNSQKDLKLAPRTVNSSFVDEVGWIRNGDE
jgi:hypothetical protein